MKDTRKRSLIHLLTLALLGCGTAGAQNFALSISNSPATAMVGGMLTYTINVTNLTASGNAVVTNFLPTSVEYVGASNGFLAGTVSNSAGQVIFGLGPVFTAGDFATLTVSVIPTSTTPLTNVAEASLQGSSFFVAATNVTSVGNQGSSLGLGISGPSSAVLANDWMTYSVSVTNTESQSAGGVVLTNTLPANTGLISVSPAAPFTQSNGVMVFNLGTLQAGAGETLFFTVQPTNSGTLAFMADAGANFASNVVAVTNITVFPFTAGELLATNSSAMAYNPQNGLMEQTIGLANIGTNAVAAARVVVSGLTNLLYDAVGTNNGNPFVGYDAALNPGQGVSLLMQYYVPTRLPITVSNSAYTAVPVPSVNLQPPSGAPFNITLMTNLPNGSILIEFQSIPGRSYTILYSDNAQMTNAMAAQPDIIAPADRTQWIDSGPPNTVSAPPSPGSRFYSVLLNP
jgi:uncharacterized repeat protein (TIGR01451 family)